MITISAIYLLISWLGNTLNNLIFKDEFSLNEIMISPLLGPISFSSFGIFLYTFFSAYLFYKLDIKPFQIENTKRRVNEFINQNIHPNDRNLVKDEDVIWQLSLSPEEIKKQREKDDTLRLGLFSLLIEKGYDDFKSTNTVLHDLPSYYIAYSQRDAMPKSDSWEIRYEDDELRLPFCLKNRVNNFLYQLNRIMKKRIPLRLIGKRQDLPIRL